MRKSAIGDFIDLLLEMNKKQGENFVLHTMPTGNG